MPNFPVELHYGLWKCPGPTSGWFCIVNVVWMIPGAGDRVEAAVISWEIYYFYIKAMLDQEKQGIQCVIVSQCNL